MDCFYISYEERYYTLWYFRKVYKKVKNKYSKPDIFLPGNHLEICGIDNKNNIETVFIKYLIPIIKWKNQYLNVLQYRI